MKRTLLAALFLGAATTVASGQSYMAGTDINPDEVTIIYDRALGEKFEIKREIVDRAQELWGEYAAYETPAELPQTVNEEIVPGYPMPAGADTDAVPEAMGDLPTLMDGGSHWVQAGNHLVEVTDDGQKVVMVVYNALP